MALFKTSARAVDMLGRQQIAGIPTAVSEIFKNAYDAYATSVRGDIFPPRRVLMIRDNGIGMTKSEFVSRWLTVGTESKSSNSTLPALLRPSEIPERKPMGEKGIGRLAIATTGPQLLVATRSIAVDDSNQDSLVVALIQWTMFEIPGLTLDEIPVPLRQLPSTAAFSDQVLLEMCSEIRSALDFLGMRVPASFRERIELELRTLAFDPAEFLRVNGPDLDASHGTAFIVAPTYDDVDAAMEIGAEDSGQDFAISEFQRFLLGFTNNINKSPGQAEVSFDTEFILHDDRGIRDLIDPSSYFWSSDDFENVDHLIDGEFDEYGMFSGLLSIYGQEPIEFTEPWMPGEGRLTECGPFKLKFGYVQGKASESRLPPEQFAQMTARLQKIGGLYIYRDGIRVLPYGNSDVDYLEVEKRRSLNAGTYYFSYRRMFGAIELDSSNNARLQEKAGREGFRENRAYRDFRKVLQNFLIQIAASYFSSGSQKSEEWRDARLRLRGRAAIDPKKAKAELRAQDNFAREVAARIEMIEAADLARDIASLREKHATPKGAEPTEATETLIRADFTELWERVDLKAPENIALTKETERDWASYQILKSSARDQIDAALVETLEIALRGREEDGGSRVDRLQLMAMREFATMADRAKQAEQAISKAHDQMVREIQSEIVSASEALSAMLQGLEKISAIDETSISRELKTEMAQREGRISALGMRADEFANGDALALENLRLKEEVLDLREHNDANLELLQLGQAVQIVSHEFEASIRAVRSGLQQLAPWARSTPRLQPIVRDLRASFGHLDGYLRLFTPLQRRLYREKVTIRGEEIESFLRGVFAERLERHGVSMEASRAFRDFTVRGYPSTFYPAFTNLVDNAIYWTSLERQSKERIIYLDALDGWVEVRDTGPGVRPRDREAIFERGFGRRRGGRGLGLAISRDLLGRDGWSLELASSQSGARFVILPSSDKGML